MVELLTRIVAVYAFSLLTTLGATAYAWRAGRGPERRLFVVTGLAVVVWTLAATTQLVVRGELLIRTFQATWILRWVSVLAWLAFVMEYTGREWRRPGVVFPAAGLFLVAGSLIATSASHDFVFSGLGTASGPIPHVTFSREIGFAALSVPAFLIIGYIFVALGRVAFQTRHESRTQALALAGGLVVPAVIALAQTAGLLPYPWVRYGALGNGVQMLGVAYGVFGGGLFSFRPISRSTVIETIDDPIVVTDERGVVVDYNEAAERIIGVAAGTPIAAGAPALVAGDPTEESQRIPDGGTPLVEHLETTVDGETRTLVVSTDEVDRGYVITCRDVTAVEAYATELERQAEQLDRFASVVSHDLRNPLTVAEGYLEMAEREIDDETTAAHLDRVASAHDRMSQLIDDTLTLARQGSVVDETESVAVGSLARDSWAYVEVDGRLVTEPADGLVIEADPDRLQSAFENLFRNAAEHADPPVTVTVGPTETGFYVADDGPGIPPADRETVFEEGFSTNDDGTGFGLAIVRSVATAHGAAVRVTDSETGGARFEFTGFEGPERARGADPGPRSADTPEPKTDGGDPSTESGG